MATDFRSIEAAIAALASEKARGDAFERAVAHLLRHDSEFGMRRVWGWHDWPGRQEVGAQRDLGIDLVAEDLEGRLVGVQAKFRIDPDRLIRWEDVATAVGYRQGLFSRRLIVTNAWDRGPNAREALLPTLAPSVEPLGWVLRDAFLASEIDWVGALRVGLSGDATPDRHPRTPRAHQLAAIRDTVALLADEPRAQLVMACGSGKTLTTLWIAEERKDERVLVLVPSLLLLRQFRRDWIESARIPFVDLVVCSDETTVGRDEISVRAADLGVPVTTDPTEIAAFLAGPGRRVIFATYQSSERIAEAQADPAIPPFDLVVADEAHKLAGVQTSGDLRATDQRVVLVEGKIRAERRLFATATPRLYGAATKARLELAEADIEIASMDDDTVFGPVAHRLTFRSAVEQGILVDYELVVIAVTNAEVADLIDRRAIVQAGDLATDAESLAFLVALRRAIVDLGLRRSISFHSSVARARAFAHWLPMISDEAPVPATGHVAGTMPTGERNRIVERLRNPEVPTLVTNARCLTEGIDMPALDAVAFVDPRGSSVDIVQAVGRAMRTAPGKTLGRLIIPVFLTEAEASDPEAAVESSAFKPVLDVLRALRAHDEELSTEATRLRVELGQRLSRLVDSGFLRDHLRVLDAATSIDVAAFERALDLRSVEVCAVPFEVGLAALRAFAERESHARVPAAHVEGGVRLGMWTALRRGERIRGRLNPSRVQALESLPGWTWDPHKDDWATGLASLRSFVAREGHALVPAKHIEAAFRLGQWVGVQRNLWTRGTLDPVREQGLTAISGWSWKPFAEDWRIGLSALRAYVAREGNARPPYKSVEGGVRLGAWVANRRTDKRNGRLDPARQLELEAVAGWTWEAWQDDWATGLASLRSFVAREGHTRVPAKHVVAGFPLGTWVAAQRHQRNAGRLDATRATTLESVPAWIWDPVGDDWEAGYAALEHFALREGHARVPVGHSEGALQLGSWVVHQRYQRKRGVLDAARAARLDAQPGWTWDPREDDWLRGMSTLHTFVAREGHARVPESHVEAGLRLGMWVRRNREDYRAGRLDPVRAASLEALPLWAWRSRRGKP